MAGLKTQNRLGSFVTIPNASKQCTLTLLKIHSAIFIALKEKLSDPSTIYYFFTGCRISIVRKLIIF